MDPLTIEAIEREKSWELEMLRMGIERFQASINPEEDVSTLSKLLGEALSGLETIQGTREPLVLLGPHKVAILALRAILQRAPGMGERENSSNFTLVAKTLGEVLGEEMALEGWTEEALGRLEYLRNSGQIGKRQFFNLKKQLGLPHKAVSGNEAIKLGAPFLEAVISGTSWFYCDSVRVGNRQTVRQIFWTQEAIDTYQTNLEVQSVSTPFRLPMLIQPRPWSEESKGGYYLLPSNLVTKGLADHTPGMFISPATYKAVNAVQNTAWVINEEIYNIALEYIDNDAWIYDEDVPDLPDFVDPEEFAKFSKEQKRLLGAERRLIHQKRKKASVLKQVRIQQMMIAGRMKDKEAFYFPYFLDFRTRMYPASTYLHPQADDFGVALLKFKAALPLGKTGLWWLKVHAANCYGKDKESLEDRVKWYDAHGKLANWKKAEEPWKFLAARQEIKRALDSGDASQYKCALPIHIDGTCNGLQHLSLMGRDKSGARSTNCTSSDVRFDIYNDIAEVVRTMVETSTEPAALEWRGKVTRNTVKRAVMTVAYGVTPYGVKRFMFDDGHVEGMQDKSAAAVWMQEAIDNALGVTMANGKAIMDTLKEWAGVCAQANRPFVWCTSAGSKCVQQYRVLSTKKYSFHFGVIYLLESNRDAPIDAGKAELAASPNVVHSQDAAHCQRVVNTMTDYGCRSFSMVHDSFGVHPYWMNDLRDVTRQEAAWMYSGNFLEDVWRGLQAEYPDLQFNEPPIQGSFDTSEVLESLYFFS